jgi:peroxiredoxin
MEEFRVAHLVRASAPLALVTFAFACTKEPNATSARASSKEQPAAANQVAEPAAQNDVGAVAGSASIGKPAPQFTLTDLAGKRISLSELAGKPVVLEWFNPGCPFVQKSHTAGSLKGLAAKHAGNSVAWLAINSGAPGKQGHGRDANREAAKEFGLTHPVLLDESGAVGTAYGAEHTPHMYVIDEKGMLVYRGAIDNSPDGEGESPQGGQLVNYVDAALADLAAGRPVKNAETEAYGCSVKYPSM